MNVTIKDVAKAAGVSVATVSRVLNSSATVSETATEQVNNAIKELGYSPNFLGRNLRKCETNIILAIIPSTEQTFYSEIIRGMQVAASDYGYDILMSTSNSTYSIEMRLLNMVFNRTVDAAILLGTQLDVKTLTELNDKHYIALCCERIEGANVLTVTVDDVGGSYKAVSRMIEYGHKRIGMVSTKVNSLSSIDREKGYRQALEEHGIEYDERYIYRGTYDLFHGELAFDHFMSMEEPPTAVFCVSDLLAVSFVKKALSKGLKIPEDISVCGFDNVPLSSMYSPGITTVEQPCYELGRTVINELMHNIINNVKSNKQIKLPYNFIERESLGSPQKSRKE